MNTRTKTDAMIAGLCIVVFVAITLGATHKARAASDDEVREFMKDVARQRYTEICAASMPKGEALSKALNEAVVADPNTWGPWVAWWNEVMAMRQKAGCGNA